MGSNRFWHIVSVVKEQLASLSSRVASNEPIKNSIPPKFVNSPFTSFFLFHKIPQPLRNPMNHRGFFRREKLRERPRRSTCSPQNKRTENISYRNPSSRPVIPVTGRHSEPTRHWLPFRPVLLLYCTFRPTPPTDFDRGPKFPALDCQENSRLNETRFRRSCDRSVYPTGPRAVSPPCSTTGTGSPHRPTSHRRWLDLQRPRPQRQTRCLRRLAPPSRGSRGGPGATHEPGRTGWADGSWHVVN